MFGPTLMFGSALRGVIAGLAAMLALAAQAAPADTLDRIKERGRLVVGVKADYRPWGFIDADGKLAGMEIDLAGDVARRMGVALELVPVQTANRIEFLQRGKIDLMIATMSDNPKRREVVGVIDPLYYAGGTNILLRKGAGIATWADMKGKRACGTQGAYYNRRVADLYGAEVVAFAGNAEALNALEGGNCVGFLQDSTLIGSMLADGDPKWAAYEMPLPTEDENGWAIAVPLADRDGAYGAFMRATVTEWHRNGTLIELERKWGVKPSPFLNTMHEKLGG